MSEALRAGRLSPPWSSSRVQLNSAPCGSDYTRIDNGSDEVIEYGEGGAAMSIERGGAVASMTALLSSCADFQPK
ncbi:MAG: hypothetical protein JST53_06610 [Actinobacteria bacterium]|nr:hypothetical protein [Actinomycetota bacterium]